MHSAPHAGDHGLRSEHPWRDKYGSAVSSHEYLPAMGKGTNHSQHDMSGFGGASNGYLPFEGQGTDFPHMDGRTSFRVQLWFDFDSDQLATYGAEHFQTFSDTSLPQRNLRMFGYSLDSQWCDSIHLVQNIDRNQLNARLRSLRRQGSTNPTQRTGHGERHPHQAKLSHKTSATAEKTRGNIITATEWAHRSTDALQSKWRC